MESLVGDASEAVVGGADESRVGACGCECARRSALRVLLEGDADAAARGVFETLLGLAAEVVVRQAATGVARGEVGIREHA